MGHIILAFVTRSEEEPLYVLGPLSNRIMDLWAVLAFGFLFIAVTVASVATQLKLSTLTATELGIIFGFALIIVWREIVKLITYKPNPKQ
jgi:hypothetical protein